MPPAATPSARRQVYHHTRTASAPSRCQVIGDVHVSASVHRQPPGCSEVVIPGHPGPVARPGCQPHHARIVALGYYVHVAGGVHRRVLLSTGGRQLRPGVRPGRQLTTRLFPESATYTLPAASTATPRGSCRPVNGSAKLQFPIRPELTLVPVTNRYHGNRDNRGDRDKNDGKNRQLAFGPSRWRLVHWCTLAPPPCLVSNCRLGLSNTL